MHIEVPNIVGKVKGPRHTGICPGLFAQVSESSVFLKNSGHKVFTLWPVFGGLEGDRTLDLRVANAALSQLSYEPICLIVRTLARFFLLWDTLPRIALWATRSPN